MKKKQLRGAIIGYGFVASKGHIPGYLERNRIQDDVEIVALADVSVSRRTLAQAVLPEAHIYCDYRDLLKSESAHLDFVDIATPPHDHAAQIRRRPLPRPGWRLAARGSRPALGA